MPGKPLSQQKKFTDSIVLDFSYVSNTTLFGNAEIAIRETKNGLELWNWDEQWTAECLDKLPSGSTWRDAVALMSSDERWMFAADPSDFSASGATPAVCQILSLACCGDEQSRRTAQLLIHIDDSGLNGLAKPRNGLLRDAVGKVAVALFTVMDQHDVDMDDLPDGVHLNRATPQGLQDAMQADISRIVAKKEAAERDKHAADELIKAQLAPFQDQIQRIIDSWRQNHPAMRGGGMSIPPSGLSALKQFLDDYVIEHQALPSGVHRIPATRGFIGRLETAFNLNFDALIAKNTGQK